MMERLRERIEKRLWRSGGRGAEGDLIWLLATLSLHCHDVPQFLQPVVCTYLMNALLFIYRKNSVNMPAL